MGTWVGKQVVVGRPGADPDILNSLAKVVVTVKGNNRFDMRLDTFDMSGTVSLDGGNAVLTTDVFMNMPLDRQPPATREMAKSMTLSPVSDGTLKLQIAGRDPITLKRSAVRQDVQPGESQRPP